MTGHLRLLIALVAVGGALALATASWAFPLRLTLAELAFWVGLTALTSGAPVRLPRGTMVGVFAAPLLAASFLGGPAAAAWVAALGTTEWRELRGRVPWYGSLFNHGEITISAVIGSITYELIAGPNAFVASVPTFAAALAGGAAFFACNASLTALSIALRQRVSVLAVVQGDLAIVAVSLLGLTPLAWLMAHADQTIGAWAALLYAVPLYTTRGAYKRVVELREMFTQTVRSLATAVDARDKFTSGHSERVQRISVEIGRVMGCSESELEALEWGGLLHDIGKIGVPDAVLLKQDRLTKEERIIMNAHPVKGEEIIKPVERLKRELPIIRHHHEWFNGSGYPDRLEGHQIPRLARILSVADAFEAMTAARPYRMRPLTPDQAIGELKKYSGIQFDPVCVEAFMKTDWASQLPDPGRPENPVVPLIAQAAARAAAEGEQAQKAS
jgi:HD-GYP domain-containing protein (c-di-GMP phosphodiesterase class II)